MGELATCSACGRKFNPTFARCPFCNAPVRPAPTSPPPGVQPAARRTYAAMAEDVIAGNRPFLFLEFHPAAYLTLDHFFEHTWGTEGKAAADPAWRMTEGQRSAILNFGVFLGELLRREFSGRWEEDPADPGNAFKTSVLLPGGLQVSPVARVYQRFRNGAAEAFEPLHRMVRGKLGIVPSPAEIPGWMRAAKHFQDARRPDLAAHFLERALTLGPALPQRTKIETLLALAREEATNAAADTAARNDGTAGVPQVSPAAGEPPGETAVGRETAGARSPAAASPPPAPEPVRDPAVWLAEIEEIEDVGKAVAAYALFTAEHPGVAEAWRELGVGLTMLNRGEEALACFDRAIALEPDEPKSYDHKAVALARLKRLAEAVRTLDDGLRHCPRSGTLLMRRGVFLDNLDRTDEAMRSFAAALQADPNYPETWAFKGDLEQRLGRTADAIASLRRYLAAHPTQNERRVLAARRQLEALERDGGNG